MVVFFLSVPKGDVITHQKTEIAITQSKMKILVKNFRSKCCLSF